MCEGSRRVGKGEVAGYGGSEERGSQVYRDGIQGRESQDERLSTVKSVTHDFSAHNGKGPL